MRLTNATRDAIVRTALERTFSAQEAAYQKATTVLADALYAHEHSAAERTAKRLPPGWVDTMNSVAIEHADFSPRYNYRRDGKPSGELKLSKPRLRPYSNKAITVNKGHVLFKQAQDVADLHQKLEKGRDALREKVRALVYGHNTVETLLKTWPEGKPYLPTSVPTPAGTALVPVQLAAEVNQLMGIKSKAK